jgi:hypothetical protein
MAAAISRAGMNPKCQLWDAAGIDECSTLWYEQQREQSMMAAAVLRAGMEYQLLEPGRHR